MSAVSVRWSAVRHRLREPIETAHGPMADRVGIVVAVEADGETGLGEFTPPAGFALSVTAAEMAVELAAERLRGIPPGALIEFDEDLPAAVDQAVWDLRARLTGVPLHRLLARRLGTVADPAVAVNGLIGIVDPSEAGERTAALRNAGYRAVKVKVGAADDRERIAAVLRAAGPEMDVRLDVNGAWSVDEAIERLADPLLERIAFVEQPVADVDDLARVRAASSVPVAADESVIVVGAVRVLEAGAADVIVLKPSLLGLARTLHAVGAARDAGVGVVVTSALDGPVGVIHAAHVAAALGEERLAAGLDTLRLLEGMPPSVPVVDRGVLRLGGDPGIGLSIVAVL